MCKSVGKVYLLLDYFDSKQSRESVNLPLTCYPSHRLTNFAFRSSEARRLLLDLDSNGDTYPLGMFPLFIKRTDVLATKSKCVFWRLVHLLIFSAC